MVVEAEVEVQPATAAHSPERWALIVPHRARLVRLATSKLRDPHEAEDCVHEVLLRTLSYAELDDTRVAAFMTTVAARLCVDRHRATTRARTLAHRMWDGGHHDGPEQQVCDRMAGQWLREQLDQLSDREREVISARADGMSTSEAAVELGISLKAAESAFTRARAKMLTHAALVA